MNLLRSKNKIIIFALVLLISLVSVFFFGGKDGEDIATWAATLLDSISELRLREFALMCNDMGLPTNYSAFSNIICAIWLLPVYLIGIIFHVNVSLFVYCTYLKIGIVIVNFIAVHFLYKSISRYNKDIREETVYLLWFSFNLVQQYSIGNGQIDIIGICLMLIALNCYFEGRYRAFSLIAGACLCFKVFPIILIAMVIAMLVADKGIKAVRYLIYILILPILQLVIEKVVFIDYDIAQYVGFEYSNSNFIDRLFEHDINISVSPIILVSVILFVLVYLLYKYSLINELDVLAVSALTYCLFFIMVRSHCQWYMYLLPLILIIGLYKGVTVEYMLLCLGFNVTEIVYNSVSTDSVDKSLYGYFVDNTGYFDYNVPLSKVAHAPEYVASIFFAFMFLFVIYYFVVRMRTAKNIVAKRVVPANASQVLLYVVYATTLLSEIIIVLIY